MAEHLTDLDLAGLVFGGGVKSYQASVFDHLEACAECRHALALIVVSEATPDAPDPLMTVDDDADGRILNAVLAAWGESSCAAATTAGTERVYRLLEAPRPPDGHAPEYDDRHLLFAEDVPLAAETSSREDLPTLHLQHPEILVKFRRVGPGGELRAYVLTGKPGIQGEILLELPDRGLIVPVAEDHSADLPPLSAQELLSTRIVIRAPGNAVQ